MNDLKFALRQLLKNPGFTAVAVLTLALGIGANTVVFSVARTVLFRPLGFEGEDRLMWIRRVNTQTGAGENQLSWQDLEDIRTATQSFETVVTDNSSDASWEDGDRSENVPAVRATPSLIDALRLRPALGRLFLPSDADAGAEPVVLISHDFWQSHFGGSPEVLDQTIRLDKKARRIVGVLPPGLQFPIQRALSAGSGSIVKVGKKPLWLPMVATYAAVALGIAAVGIFGVLAYQVAQRRNEFGVRLALGASPRGLMRLVLLQAGRLALVGLTVGLAVSFASNRLLASQLFGLSPHDPFLLTAVSVILFLVALLASFVPARRAARVDPMEALRYE